MKTFVLDSESLKKGWGAEDQYWFSITAFNVIDISESAHIDRPSDISETEFMFSLGYIPYFRVNRLELAKAFTETIENKKLKASMDKIEDKQYIETFWKYYNVYPETFEKYEQFQNDYLLKKAERWCTENGIEYVVK